MLKKLMKLAAVGVTLLPVTTCSQRDLAELVNSIEEAVASSSAGFASLGSRLGPPVIRLQDELDPDEEPDVNIGPGC